MKRIIVALILTLALCATAVTITSADEWNGATTGVPLVASSWVYAEANARSAYVGQITYDNTYTISEVKDGWTKIFLPDGTAGWVPESAIDYLWAIPSDIGIPYLRRAVVICEGLSLRETPSTGAKRLASMPNGSHGYILAEEGEWLQVTYFHYTKSAGYQQLTGWVQQDYTVESPAYIHTVNRTEVYAFSSTDAPVVGQTLSGQRLAVIGETNGFYVVNLRSASGFIRKSATMWTERQVFEGVR